MPTWRVAGSLLALRTQVNDRWPKRDRTGDGTIGDAAHASRSSDHNPWVEDARGIGVVTAMDIDDDDRSGADMRKLLAAILADRDPRLKYAIHEGRIYSGSTGAKPWQARPYHGPNAHQHHLHVSVKPLPRYYDDRGAWALPGSGTQAGSPLPVTSAVVAWQDILEMPTLDGRWGPATEKRASQMLWVVRHGGVKGASPATVRGVQAILDVRSDGQWGPVSRIALVEFVKRVQRLVGVKADGAWGPKSDAAYVAFRVKHITR